jgi:two-component system, OmpR family, osmolarity sensor histidine kinase EnvZ
LRLLPRTLFWRAFAAQMLIIVASLALATFAVSRDQARTTAEHIAAVWAPALRHAIDEPNPAVARIDATVQRDVSLVQSDPPPNMRVPWASLRFDALRAALQDAGLPVDRIGVSGVTDDSVAWVHIRQGERARWIGVVSNLEGEDFPRRVLAVSLAGVALAALVAAALSRMVARPAQQLARAVEAFGQGAPLPAVPTRAPKEIHALARSVERSFEQRHALDQQRQLMLSGLSHDVRSPLTRIRLAAELLPDSDAEVRDLKQRIEANVSQLDGLVGSFSDYVRAEEGVLDGLAEPGGVALASARSFGLGPHAVTVRGDGAIASRGDLLRRAVDNLVDNALRYGNGMVSIDVTESAGEWRVAVRNEGDPIDATDIARLRKPFERGEPHRGTPGTGLGLAIVERIAARHGGRLEIEALQQPRGTRATLVLPRRAGAAARVP